MSIVYTSPSPAIIKADPEQDLDDYCTDYYLDFDGTYTEYFIDDFPEIDPYGFASVRDYNIKYAHTVYVNSLLFHLKMQEFNQDAGYVLRDSFKELACVLELYDH